MLKNRFSVVILGLVMVLGGVLMAVPAKPASAATVYNWYECHPSSGWCYQTNPPYNPNFPRSCRWNYTIPYFTGGMWYTGCTKWRPEVH